MNDYLLHYLLLTNSTNKIQTFHIIFSTFLCVLGLVVINNANSGLKNYERNNLNSKPKMILFIIRQLH